MLCFERQWKTLEDTRYQACDQRKGVPKKCNET